MKLLFDQNLSPRLVRRLEDLYPASAHVSEHGLGEANDLEIWRHARAQAFLIVTKDTDFNDLASIHGSPPKIIWIRRGNCTTNEIEEILRNDFDSINRGDDKRPASPVLEPPAHSAKTKSGPLLTRPGRNRANMAR